MQAHSTRRVTAIQPVEKLWKFGGFSVHAPRMKIYFWAPMAERSAAALC
jgi:hypothetical protein